MRRSTRAAAKASQQATSYALKRDRSQSTSSKDETIKKRTKRSAPKKNVVKESPDVDVKQYSTPASDIKPNISKPLDSAYASKKWKSWSANASSTPYPDFKHPTNRECHLAYDMLYSLHNSAVEAEFNDTITPETIPFVLDAMMVAVLSQATSWSNAKRAMDSMKNIYGSVFAYENIYTGGSEKLQKTIRCGGLHVRKTKIIMSILDDVKRRYGKWNLDHLLAASDEDAMQELLSYKYIGSKSAFVVMGWCLKRNRFTVDVHVHRIAGLWGWIPEGASRENAQLHLDAVVPGELKFKLHFFLIQHGRTCVACRGGSRVGGCEVKVEVRRRLGEEEDVVI